MTADKLYSHLCYWQTQEGIALLHNDYDYAVWARSVAKSIARKIRQLAPDWAVYVY